MKSFLNKTFLFSIIITNIKGVPLRTAPEHNQSFDMTSFLFQFFAYMAFLVIFPFIIFTSAYAVIYQNHDVLDLNLYLIFADIVMSYMALVFSSFVDCRYMECKKQFFLTKSNLGAFLKFSTLLLLLFLATFFYIQQKSFM